jgi:hypothetical protein
MEISDLTRRFVENYDRILPEMIEMDDQVWKTVSYLVETEKYLIAPWNSAL